MAFCALPVLGNKPPAWVPRSSQLYRRTPRLTLLRFSLVPYIEYWRCSTYNTETRHNDYVVGNDRTRHIALDRDKFGFNDNGALFSAASGPLCMALVVASNIRDFQTKYCTGKCVPGKGQFNCQATKTFCKQV
ncbi:hypothetical protein Tdes44962_MAKER06757 [Teratosphaeria destructans]|uniref:Uncharacterized protein n=1 Tax=Teratosphaeria destructans TaxID=418781 RepID=A0A9W7T150_9PEZI|nr:hypothetical protein Tdes44962_MAKER06757 [Teratosphaeria destructans]